MPLKLTQNQLIKIKSISVTELLFYLYIFSIVSFSGMKVGNVVSKLIGLVLIFYFLVYDVLRKNKKVYFFDECKPLFLFLIAGLLSGFGAKDQVIYLTRLTTVIQLGVFFVIGYSIVRNYDIEVEHLFYLIIFSTCFVFLQGIIFSSTASAHLVDERLASAQGNANTLANFGAFSFLFLIYLFLQQKNKLQKFFIFSLLLFVVYGILETESRKGMLLIPIIVFVYLFFQSVYHYSITNNKKLYLIKISMVLFGLLGLFGLGIYIITQTQYFERFQQLSMFLELQSGGRSSAFKNIIDYSTYERRQFIKYAIAMWKDHFWFGVGLDNFRNVINEYWISSRQTYSHNNYVEMLSTSGIVGTITYYSLYFVIILNLFKTLKLENLSPKYRSLMHIFITGMFSLMIAELVIVSYYKKFFWLMFLIYSVYPNVIKEETKVEMK